MADVFAWRPIDDTRGRVTARVNRAQFGDGYSQAVPDGINHTTQEWPLTFAGHEADMQALVDFLAAHVGRSFQWKPLLGPIALWQCDSWQPKDEGGGWFTVTATFQQTFSP